MTAPGHHEVAAAVRRALFGVGPIATARSLLKHALRRDPAARSGPAPAPRGPHPFDVAFGVQTDGFSSWRENLASDAANAAYSSGYLGVAPSVARRLIATVRDPERFTFIDFGCGKGRALIVASERPFRRILGVEFVPGLAEAARQNAAAIRAAYPARTAIEVHQGDAAAMDLPDGPLVLFFYQPFEMPVMRKVLRRLQDALSASARPVIVLYVNPALARAFDRVPVLEPALDATLELREEEKPFAYAGRGGTDRVRAWRTRAPRPELDPIASA